MNLKELTAAAMSNIVGIDAVITEEAAIRADDGRMVRTYWKAFDYVPEHSPLCIVRVKNVREAASILKYCNENDIHVIVKTGASSSEDQLLVDDERTIIIDASRMNAIKKIDTENMVVTAECGVPIAVLEEKVREMGFTLGHAPQSLPLASMGGLVATRSTGQFSTYYGGIEDLVCGLEAVLPNGEFFRIRPVPRRSAGPDLRQLVVGSEGALMFISEVTVKIFPWYPDELWMGGYIVKNFEIGIKAIREIMVRGFSPAVVRLYDKTDVDHNYGSVKLKDNEAFMFFSVEGPKVVSDAVGCAIHEIAMSFGSEYIGTSAVEHWFLTRNNVCNIVGTEKEYAKFRETGVYNSTVEVCADWSEIGKVYEDAMKEITDAFPNLTMLGGHVSHSYINGTNVYFVYAFKVDEPKNAHVEQYRLLDILSGIMLRYNSGTIVHHHGVGKMRVGRIKEELGSSYPLLLALKKELDPNGIMNPGCLIPRE